jgi:enoyl-CoA hydratase/carnithine racemase
MDGVQEDAKLLSVAGPLGSLERTIMAGIQGDAAGRLGLALALSCDMRVESETSGFGLPQIDDGLVPWDIICDNVRGLTPSVLPCPG